MSNTTCPRCHGLPVVTREGGVTVCPFCHGQPITVCAHCGGTCTGEGWRDCKGSKAEAEALRAKAKEAKEQAAREKWKKAGDPVPWPASGLVWSETEWRWVDECDVEYLVDEAEREIGPEFLALYAGMDSKPNFSGEDLLRDLDESNSFEDGSYPSEQISNEAQTELIEFLKRWSEKHLSGIVFEPDYGAPVATPAPDKKRQEDWQSPPTCFMRLPAPEEDAL